MRYDLGFRLFVKWQEIASIIEHHWLPMERWYHKKAWRSVKARDSHFPWRKGVIPYAKESEGNLVSVDRAFSRIEKRSVGTKILPSAGGLHSNSGSVLT